MTDRPLKAYYVEEDWLITKGGTVWANSAVEAKQKVRRLGEYDERDLGEAAEVGERPKGIRACRLPSADRQPHYTGGDEG